MLSLPCVASFVPCQFPSKATENRLPVIFSHFGDGMPGKMMPHRREELAVAFWLLLSYYTGGQCDHTGQLIPRRFSQNPIAQEPAYGQTSAAHPRHKGQIAKSQSSKARNSFPQFLLPVPGTVALFPSIEKRGALRAARIIRRLYRTSPQQNHQPERIPPVVAVYSHALRGTCHYSSSFIGIWELRCIGTVRDSASSISSPSSCVKRSR